MSAAMDKARRIPRRIESGNPYMKAELDSARAWDFMWNELYYRMAESRRQSRKKWFAWEKRMQWARHRLEQAERATFPSWPRCWFCERPGHDETLKPCWRRRAEARKWVYIGKRWRGKEEA